MEKSISMKVLIVNFSDIEGGAARAAYRLHQALLGEDIDSYMLVQKKKSDDFTVLEPKTTLEKVSAKINGIINPLPLRLYKPKGTFSTSFVSSYHIIKRINELKPDIVHLHWINAGMLKVEDLAKINAPIVWSLHDNWAFTGGCHIMWDCEKYKNECEACPRLCSSKKNDLSHKIFTRKQKVFQQIENLTVVGLSKWLTNRAQESTLIKDQKIINLPNPIDTTIFKYVNKNTAREMFNLPQDKKLILFGAVLNATTDINKGFSYLIEALKKLKKPDVELVVLGSTRPELPYNFGFNTHYIGKLYDDVSLSALYSASDVLIVPSIQENLSNMIMESMACSTPVVAFDIGGNEDMIDHKINGYLAQAFDTVDMAKGIEWVINNSYNKELSLEAREKVLSHFESSFVAKKYIDLYQDILISAEKTTKV